jgi:hypothetical protein
MKEVENVLRILEETKRAIAEDDPAAIKELSNQTINTASLTQDVDNIAVAVIVYSIGKILERENYKTLQGWKAFYTLIISALDKSIKDVKAKDEVKFRRDFEQIRTAIGKLSGKLKEYVKEVLRKAQINKASRIYEHGVSMEQTAKLLGISMYELAEYSGKTGIHDVKGVKTMTARARIKLAEEIFG